MKKPRCKGKFFFGSINIEAAKICFWLYKKSKMPKQ